MNIALNPFDKGRKPEHIDDVVMDTTVKDAVDYFRSLNFSKVDDVNDAYKKLRRLELQVLEPSLIDVVYQNIRKEEFGSSYVSALINTSFRAGNNDFMLTTCSDELVATHLRGLKRRRLKLNVHGDVGFGFALKARYCDFVVEGNGGDYLGGESKDCVFTLKDVGVCCGIDSVRSEYNIINAGVNCGENAVSSTFTLQGDCAESLGQNAYYSKFIVYGDTKAWYGAQATYCTFELHGNFDPNFGLSSQTNTYRLKKSAVDKLDRDLLDVLKLEVIE